MAHTWRSYWRKGYEVYGLVRRASKFNIAPIEHLYLDPHHPTDAHLFLDYGLSDGARMATLLSAIRPDELYNLVAQWHVRVSFDDPESTGDTTGIRNICLLEAGATRRASNGADARRPARGCSALAHHRSTNKPTSTPRLPYAIGDPRKAGRELGCKPTETAATLDVSFVIPTSMPLRTQTDLG
jgi:GDP-D-mannose dehydratase